MRRVRRVDRFAKPCKIAGFPVLWSRVAEATHHLCFSALEYIERMLLAYREPNARMQKSWNGVEFEELHTEITAFVHDLIRKPVPQECAVSKTHSGSTVAAGTEAPPNGTKQHSHIV